MKKSVYLLILFLALTLPSVVAQDAKPAEEVAKPDEEVAKAIEALSEAHKKKVEAEQIHFTKKLGEKWGVADPKQRSEVHGLMSKNLKSSNQELREATVEVLAAMTGGEKDKDAERSTKILVDESNKKPNEKDPTFLGKILVAVGRVQHKKGIAPLVKRLKYKDFAVIAAAVEGLGHYKGADLTEKKDIVENVLKMYTSAWNQAKKEPGNPNFKTRLEQVNRPSEATLKALTNATVEAGADKWWTWWNNEGKKARQW